MKPILFFSAVLLTLASCTGSDAPAKAQKDPLQDSASFTTIQWLDSTKQDLGKVIEGAKVQVYWRFRNTGSKPLVIEKAQPGCGCTIAEKPEAPVLPGQEGRISATFNSEGRPGNLTKNVMVLANTKPRTDHDLQFTIEVAPQ